jgi:hypothetical protein
VKALANKFPKANIFCTKAVADQLTTAGVKNVSTTSAGDVVLTPAPHESMEPIFEHPVGDNIAIDFNNKVTDPGDSYQINKSCEVLFLPIDAPWGSNVLSLRLAEKLMPKVVLPVHDVMLTQAWKQTVYDWCEGLFKKHGIRFIKPEPGKPIEI